MSLSLRMPPRLSAQPTRGKNAVLIGEDDWKAIEETLYLMSIPGMTESIIDGGNTDISECLDESEVDW